MSKNGMTGNEKKNPKLRLVTPAGRVSFPKVFKAEAFEDQQPKFSCILLFDKKKMDITEIRKALLLALKTQWPKYKDLELGEEWPEEILNPISDGDKKKDLDGYKGMWVVAASNKLRPRLVKKVDGEIIDIEEGTDEFYAGCYARMDVRAYAWEFKSKKGTVLKRGVSLSLENVLKTGEGPRFSGKRSAEEAFGDIEVEETMDNSEDDDAGF